MIVGAFRHCRFIGAQRTDAAGCNGTKTAPHSLLEDVLGLVYIAAFGLDEGESLGALLSQGRP
jgi:hypothetical protein